LTTEVPMTAAAPPQPGPKPYPRGRTALFAAAAVVLGVLAGGAAGYAAQDASAPTPLPALAVAQPKYPAVHLAVAPSALPASEDDMVRTDGDLTKLLVPAPAGATAVDPSGNIDFWLNIAQVAEGFDNPGQEFANLSDAGFRRAAEANWEQGGDVFYEIRLVQYSHAEEASSLQYEQGILDFTRTWTGSQGVALPTTDDDLAFAGTKSHTSGNTYYEGRALGVHGDIAVEIFVQSPGPVSTRTVETVLQNQLERL